MRRWVPRPFDLVAAAILTVASQLEIWLLGSPDLPLGALSASYAVGTVACAWHRVAPMAALVLGLTGLGVVPGTLGVDPAWNFGWLVAALALMASVGYHARRPVLALLVSLALWATGVVAQKGFVPADVLYAWLLAGAAWVAGRALAGRTLRAELSEQRAVAAEQQAQWRAAVAVAEERLRIAREIHDVVSHGVSVMTLHVSGVRRLLRPDQERERAALEAVERTGRESLAEMHRMLGVLRAPDVPEDFPAPDLAHLPDLLEPARAAGLRAGFTVDGEVRPLPAGVELAAYRIVQEAITNVLRHAAATRVDCTVAFGPAAVRLRVVDDGRGGAALRQGHGLVGMRERAAAYGGTVSAGPRPGGGWAVDVLLPVDRAAPVPVAEEAS
ncbi:sensor histidine kinase [Blastococcus sp. PRF04-17]|uniref:sensor histidine kinase n=1 Tax=Blastococcus sp. PRF04-17 TaxID=2933797 RepID=UPI001FF5E7D1|nr:sensor histidine kinase [Blastococcus sp. PRF04-17]UOY03939.1 sensor histidine kinase [Blastococcus sp. PRF04-17]